jgi:hypothetical protein
MERKLRFLEKEIKKDSIPMMETTEPPDAPQPRYQIPLSCTVIGTGTCCIILIYTVSGR